MEQGRTWETIMKILNKQMAAIVLGMALAGVAQGGDMSSAVAYSMGEFDRVGASQPLPKTQAGKRDAAQRNPGKAQTVQEREMSARKAEFVRRMFWVALAAR
jgi:hypothetical protein